MKDRALSVVASRRPGQGGVNLLREYVQSRILGQMQEAGAFVPLAFMGGTALRFLYAIPRFSEDLEFTLERNLDGGFGFKDLVEGVRRGLEREGYGVSLKVNDSATVAKALIGFPELLYEAGLSPHGHEVLWVRLEVDTNAPAEAHLEVTTVDRFGLLRIQHHDLSSLMAGKIAALIGREYTKGRDLYDLLWYLTRERSLEPNVELMRNALLQVAPEHAASAAADWRAVLRDRLAQVDWTDARRDVAPFLEQARDVDLIDGETFERLLGG